MSDALAPKKVDDLRDERAQVLNQIDDIVNTITDEGREWTDEERAKHDALEARHDELVAAIAKAEQDLADAKRVTNHTARKSAYAVPNVNTRGDSAVGANVTRDLDELLWATDPQVTASNGRAVVDVEQIAIRNDANDPGRPAPRTTDFRPEDRGVVREFQNVVADMAIAGMLMDEQARTSSQGFQSMRDKLRKGAHNGVVADLAARWERVQNALDVDTSGEGGTWVPTGIGASLHEQVRASGKVAPLFTRINLPTNPWKWPIEGSDLTAYRVAEPTSDSATKVGASTSGTVAATFDAEIFGARSLWSRSLDADSAIAIAGYQRMKLVQAFVDAEEKAILDGDTDGTHQDSDTQSAGATHASSAWDGLRKKALAQTVATATACGVDELNTVRAAMGKWGANPRDLAFIIGVSNLYDLLVDDKIVTLDKYGPNAPVLNGEVGSVFGIPVIVSEHVRENLNASGVYDGITETKTYMLCVNRNEFALGQRMALDVKTSDELYLETFQRVAVAFMREDFAHIGSAATNDDVAIAYNVAP